MNRIRIALVAAVGVAFLVTALVAGSTHWTHSSKTSSPLRYIALADGDTGEQLGLMDSYWNDRVTYPTGNYNPAWLRHAAEQADKIPSGIPAGRPGGGAEFRGRREQLVRQRVRLARARSPSG